MHQERMNDSFKFLSNASNDNVSELLSSLKLITAELKEENVRSELTAVNWNNVGNFLTVVLNYTQTDWSLAAEIFRLLRNACAGCELNQKHILNTPYLLDNVLVLFLRSYDEQTETCLLCGLQFFGNFVSGDTETSIKCKLEIINRLGLEGIKNILWRSKTKQHGYVATMILYNCLKRDEIKTLLLNSEQLASITELLLENMRSDNASEFSLWIIQEMLPVKDFLPIVYDELDVNSRYALIDIVHDTLVGKETVEKNFNLLHERNFSYLLSKLSKHLLDIVEVVPNSELTDSDDSRPLEVRKLLAVACEPFSLEANSFTNAINDDSGLLEALLDTLRTLHLLAKADAEKYGSLFKPISSLRLPEATDKDTLEASPVYGFKRDLVRLIGNMCFQCKANQDLVGRLHGIPLLLDCCHIDARNPYIMQWAIFAVRNATNGHQPNQSVIADLVDHGTLQNSPLLNELGLTFENGKLTKK